MKKQLNEVLDDNAKNLIHAFWYKKLPAKAVQRLKTFWPHLIEAILQSNKPQVALLRLPLDGDAPAVVILKVKGRKDCENGNRESVDLRGTHPLSSVTG